MEYLDLSCPAPHHNLACDEALLELAEDGDSGETLRFWESKTYFAVLGYSNKINSEVTRKSCASDNLPILRRPSGGGTVLQGPGCLNYALILNISSRPDLKTVKSATDSILEIHRKALQDFLGQNVQVAGESDLVVGNLKFSGNAQRRKKDFLLFHGTFLLDMDFGKIERYLALPSKQPAYRQGRRHEDFLTNISVCGEKLKEHLKNCWEAVLHFNISAALDTKIHSLVREKYSNPSWNEKF